MKLTTARNCCTKPAAYELTEFRAELPKGLPINSTNYTTAGGVRVVAVIMALAYVDMSSVIEVQVFIVLGFAREISNFLCMDVARGGRRRLSPFGKPKKNQNQLVIFY